METFTQAYDPRDPQYMIKRQRQLTELSALSTPQLKRMVNNMLMTPMPKDALEQNTQVAKGFINELSSGNAIHPSLKKSILDSTGGGTSGGSVMIRQDLEVPLYLLFIREFPFYERIEPVASNGLIHAYNQVTAVDAGALGSSLITETGAVTYSASTYARGTAPIAVFGQGRGVSLKEIAAVRQGGAAYDPSRTELADGMLRLSTDIQYFMFQGNASNSSGTAAQEAGLYNANGIDGVRGVLGSVTAFSSNGAIQVDVGSLNITESIQVAATKAANNGGHPSCVVLSINAKQALDIEQQGNKRYTDNLVDIIPGVQTSQIPYSNGMLTIVPVPGTTLGTYNRTSDNALVEDMYILDESTIKRPWLYSEGFTTLQIPSGVDGVLSDRWIIFSMSGLEIAAPLFCAKVRRLAA